MEGNFTVITVSQQTENDMATWNTNVSNERKQLLASVSFFPIFSLILNYIYIFFLYSSLQGPGGRGGSLKVESSICADKSGR